jgi:hypothetical protein
VFTANFYEDVTMDLPTGIYRVTGPSGGIIYVEQGCARVVLGVIRYGNEWWFWGTSCLDGTGYSETSFWAQVAHQYGDKYSILGRYAMCKVLGSDA